MSHKFTANQIDNLSSSLELDLTAIYSMMKEDILKLLDEAEKNEWTPDQFISKVENLISGAGNDKNLS